MTARFEHLDGHNKKNSTSRYATGLPMQLRYWRHLRGFSQLELALEAGLSARHVSFLETGRSKASDDTIARLSTALRLSYADAMSLRRANAGLRSIPHHPDPQTRATLNRMVEAHAPYPALIVDSIGTIHGANDAMRLLIASLPTGMESSNLFELYFSPYGFRTIVDDAEHVARMLFSQIRRDLLAVNRPEAMCVLEYLTRLAPDLASLEPSSMKNESRPGVESVVHVGGTRLHLSSMFASFGSEDAGNQSDWRVETVFPLNDETAEFFTAPSRRSIRPTRYRTS